MTKKKYTLVKSDTVTTLDGRKLFRIKAAVAIAALGIAKGDLGGYIESEANLSQVSGNAWVYGNAQVYGDAQVSGNAWVYGNARVYGDAQVYGIARVYGNARVSGNARVYGNALGYGVARVSGNAQVYGNVRVYGNALVYGDSWVYGNAQVYGNARVYGNAFVYGDAQVYGVNLIATRSDGYTFLVAPTPDGPRVIAGCRYFTFDQAEKHWAETRGGTPLGDESLSIVAHLKRMAEINRFMEPVKVGQANG